MTWTRAQLRTFTQRVADAEGSDRWNTTVGETGEIDRFLGIAHDREWKTLLNANPRLRISKRTPTADSSGRFAVTDLSSGSGDSKEWFYRIYGPRISVSNDWYREVPGDSALLAWENNSSGNVWYRQGDYLHVLPKPTSGTVATGIWVAHLPTRVDLLTADSVVFTFPVGYEPIVAYEAGALMLSKGGAETQAAQDLRYTAGLMRSDMLSDFARDTTGPKEWRYSDDPREWGSI